MFLRRPKQKNDSMSNLPGVYLHLSILEHVAITTASVRYLESVVTNVTRILSVFLTSYARLSTPGARNVRRHLCCLLKVLSWWALIRSHWFRITYLPKVESMSPYNYGYRGTGIHDRTTPTRLRSRIYLFIHILGPDRWWTNRKVLCLCASYRYNFYEPRGVGTYSSHVSVSRLFWWVPLQHLSQPHWNGSKCCVHILALPVIDHDHRTCSI